MFTLESIGNLMWYDNFTNYETVKQVDGEQISSVLSEPFESNAETVST